MREDSEIRNFGIVATNPDDVLAPDLIWQFLAATFCFLAATIYFLAARVLRTF